MFLVSPVVPQTQVAMSSSLKAYSLSQEKGTKKAALLGGVVILPPSSYFYSAVSRMLPRLGAKPIFIADGSSCLCQRERALQKIHWQVQPFQKKSPKEKLLWECCHGSNETLCLRKKHFILHLHPSAEPSLNVSSIRQGWPSTSGGLADTAKPGLQGAQRCQRPPCASQDAPLPTAIPVHRVLPAAGSTLFKEVPVQPVPFLSQLL